MESVSDLTVVIPARGPALGLWSTLCSCEDNLASTKLDVNYVLVTNGESIKAETELILRYFKQTGKLLAHVHSEEPLTPPVARARGVAVSDGDCLLFLDNHVSLNSRFIERAFADMEKHDIDILHSSVKFWCGDITHYHYRLKLGFNFWGDSTTMPLHGGALPYRCAAAGHGAFFVKRSVWDAIGGYGPDSVYQGYAGEELNFDLKAWRMGFNNWIDPKLLHYHWAGDRNYDRHYSDDYYTNLMVSALVIGGENWLNKVYESFTSGQHLRISPKTHMFDLLQTAYKRGTAYSKELDSNSVHTLDAALSMFKRDLIAH